jgi:uncharacterized YceG family protein
VSGGVWDNDQDHGDYRDAGDRSGRRTGPRQQQPGPYPPARPQQGQPQQAQPQPGQGQPPQGQRYPQGRSQPDPRRQPAQPGSGSWPVSQNAGSGNNGGYGDWEQEPEDSSFLPGFGQRDPDYRDTGGRGRAGSPAPGRDRYDYDDQRGQRPSWPDGAGLGSGQPGGTDLRGTGPRQVDPRSADPRRTDPRGTDPRAAGSGDALPPGPPGDGDWSDRDWNRRGDDWQADTPRPRKRATRWLPRILILVVVLAVVIGGSVGGLAVWHKYQARYHPADYTTAGTGDVTVQVPSGATAFSLAPELFQLHVIASERAFTNAAESATSTTSSGSGGLEAGYYQLKYHMKASAAWAALLNAKNLVQVTVTIPEGKRAVDVISIVSKKTKIPLKNFQAVLKNPKELGLPSYADGIAEGYLFPATYAISPHETALQILQAMVQRFQIEADQSNLEAEAKSVGLTPTQLIIEASLAQAEGGSVADYPKIAEVIHNRLAIGMRLQFDSTVLYGLSKYAVSATIKQTHTPGPYNTYINTGLPPGAISNPGDAAIQGILHPAHGNWIYFLTKPGGKSQFSHDPLTGQ